MKYRVHRKKTMPAGGLLVLAVLLLPATTPADSDVAPDFSLPGREKAVEMVKLRGKVVYVDFWASWCGPCRQSFPWMNRMHKRYADRGLVVVAINLDKSREPGDEFLKETPGEFGIAYDPEGKTASAYGVKVMPSSYLVDRQGRIHSRHVGFREHDANAVEAAIQSLIEK